ncbi:MAG: hypothetical protein CVU34_20505 [Betaproteobacteria bacterium HGW-Betaproteobacteria-7]|jgi:hypothetical protein|nr:MAG: hypothetical protein CVU34_20505 [Betaproteobacteria bacterium HGW-Betaproteobacteria-7]
MKSLFALLVALLGTSASAELTLNPAQFAYRGIIHINEKGPYQQVSLPLSVYQGLASPDLADLRVFNERGEVLPYAIVPRESSVETHRKEQQVPFFPLHAPAGNGSEAGDIAVTIRQTGDGSLISVRQSAPASSPAEVVRGLVLDASRLKGSVRSLRLVDEAGTTPFHAYTIESSQDLQHWRMLKRDAQLVRLSHEGHRVDLDGAEWDVPADRYLRLLWADPQRAPVISAVLLSSVERRYEMPQRIWSTEIRPNAVSGGDYEYVWTGQMPLEMLRINLPQMNSLAPLAIQQPVIRSSRHRHRDELRWRTVAQSVVYRLESPQGEIRSPDIALDQLVGNRLRLSLDRRAGKLGEAPPTLQIGFVPREIVFLARGDGPFILAWGAKGLGRVDLPLSTLLPEHDGKAQLPARQSNLSLAETMRNEPGVIAGKSAAADPGITSNKWILWLVLLGGLLILGGMARALTRQLHQGEKPE